MKININMAIGFVKRFLLKILLEDNEVEKQKLSELLMSMLDHIDYYANTPYINREYFYNLLFLYHMYF